MGGRGLFSADLGATRRLHAFGSFWNLPDKALNVKIIQAMVNNASNNDTTTARNTRANSGRRVRTPRGQNQEGQAPAGRSGRGRGAEGVGRSASSRATTARRTRATPAVVPIVHCVLSAAFHDGEGPVYGVVDGVLDGKAMVKYVNETGLDAMVEVNEASILTGDDVEEQWVNGKPAELRYRYSLVPVEEEVAHWRLCQVEKIEQGGDGVHMAVFRVKNDNEGVMKMSVDEYRDLAISVSKEDFILGIGDKTGMDVSDGEMKAALDATDRREARLNHPTMSSVKLVGRFGFVERTTLEGHHRWLKRNNEDEEG